MSQATRNSTEGSSQSFRRSRIQRSRWAHPPPGTWGHSWGGFSGKSKGPPRSEMAHGCRQSETRSRHPPECISGAVEMISSGELFLTPYGIAHMKKRMDGYRRRSPTRQNATRTTRPPDVPAFRSSFPVHVGNETFLRIHPPPTHPWRFTGGVVIRIRWSPTIEWSSSVECALITN